MVLQPGVDAQAKTNKELYQSKSELVEMWQNRFLALIQNLE